MILGKSYFFWASIVIQLVLIWVNRGAPEVQPKRIKDRFTDGITGISIILTGTMVTLFPVRAPIFAIAIVLLFFAILPPFVGLAENKLRQHGNEIFDVKKRFWGHLASNVVGVGAAILFFATVSTTPGLVAFAANFRDASAFNVVLPLSTVVVFAFVRWQQITDCPNIDELVNDKGDWESQIRGSSLTAGHQIANTIHLLLVNFFAASSVVYLLGYAILQAKNHQPLDFTWQMGCAMALFVLFLFVCGSPLLWQHRAVYLTFLTGTPGAIIVAMIWLALLKHSFARNLFAVLLVGLGYLLYCALAVLGLVYGQRQTAGVTATPGNTSAASRPPQDKVELFYFSAAIFALALSVLLGALYFSSTGQP